MTLREIRFRRNITLKQLSLMSGVDIASLSHIERGLQKPSDKHKMKICQALGYAKNHIQWEIEQ